MSKLTKAQETLTSVSASRCPLLNPMKFFPLAFLQTQIKSNKTYSSQRIEHSCLIADKMPNRCYVPFIPFHLLSTLAVAREPLKGSLG